MSAAVTDAAPSSRVARRPAVAVLALICSLFFLFDNVAWALPAACGVSGNMFSQGGTGPAGSTPTASTTADGSTISTGTCDADGAGGYSMFANVICFAENDMGEALTQMYCALSVSMKPAIQALMALVVVIFGIALATGITRMGTREVMITMFKIALVYAFATNADYAISIGYKFFLLIANEGSQMVTGGIGHTGTLDAPDAALANFIAGGTRDPGTPAPGGYVTMGTAGASGAQLSPWCAGEIFFVLALFMLFIPPIFFFIVALVVQWVGLYARAVLGYVTAIVFLSFLFVLSPIFISFALFSATRKIFETWIKYLTTYSLQVVMLFAFLALLNAVPLGPAVTQVVGMVKEYDIDHSHWLLNLPFHTCGICTYTPISATAPTRDSVTGLITLACDNGTAAAPQNLGQTAPLPDPPDNAPYVVSADKNNYVISLWALLKGHNDLILAICSNVIALWIIGKVLGEFLKRSSELAKQLAGALPNAVALGGASPEFPGLAVKLIGLESVQAGMVGFGNRFRRDGFTRNIRGLLGESLASAGTAMLQGADDETTAAGRLRARRLRANDLEIAQMRRSYFDAKNKTLANYDSMQAAYRELSRLERNPNATQAELMTARNVLSRSHKNHMLSMSNEPDQWQQLQDAVHRRNANESATPQYRGLLGRRKMDETGNRGGQLRSQGSLAEGSMPSLAGDDVRTGIDGLDRQWEKRGERDTYGRTLDYNPERKFYFMQAEGLPMIGGNVNLSEYRNTTNQLYQNLIATMETSRKLLPPAQMVKFEAAMSGVRAALESATTPNDYQEVMQTLKSISSAYSTSSLNP